MIQPVKRTRAYEDIVRQLADMVQRGELQPGDRLPSERELAASFCVGRPTLRQALTVLAEAGIIEILPGSGVYLRRHLDESPGAAGHAMAMVLLTETKSLQHLLELRVGVESEAAYLAALRRTDEQLEKLKQAFDEVEAAFAAKIIGEQDYRFHATIAEATGNPIFVRVMTSLTDLFMKQFRVINANAFQLPQRVAETRREHEEIFRAILEQRPAEARKAMIVHLLNVSKRLKLLEQNGGQ